MLLVQQGMYNISEVTVRQIIDLATGKVLASCDYPEVYKFENGTIHTTHLLSPWCGSSGKVFVVGTTGSSKETSKDCLWEWNVLTNEKRLLHTDGYLFPSRDGSTLVEHFDFPLSPFEGLFPGNILGVISSALITNGGWDGPRLNTGISCWRFWSLPDVSKRCTIVAPSFVDRSACNLSNDGRWLILYDHFIDSDRLPSVQSTTTSVTSPRSQNMIKVYDTLTGQLWCEIPAPPGLHNNMHHLDHGFSTLFPVAFDRQDSNQANGEKQKRTIVWRLTGQNSGWYVSSTSYLCYFHLPTKTWLALEGENSLFEEVPSSMENCTSLLRYSTNSPGLIKMSATDQQGTTTPAGFVDLDTSGEPKLVPYTTQMVFQREAKSSFPEWMIEYLPRFNWLVNWLDQQRYKEIIVHDYQRNKTLWRLRVSHAQDTHLAVTPTGSFLIVNRLVADHYEVTVLALPFADWSAWWSRGAGGVVTAALLWLFFRRRK